MIGQTEILIIGGVIILLFGAAALPKLARSLGKAKREFQKGMEEEPDQNSEDDDPIAGKETGAAGDKAPDK